MELPPLFGPPPPPPLKTGSPYSPEVVANLRLTYIIAALIWIVVMGWLGLYRTDIMGWLILLIPFGLFAFAICNLDDVTDDMEDEVFQANYLTVGLLIILPLLTWMNKDYGGDKSRFISMLVMVIIFILLSMLDIWVKRGWLSVVRHVKSTLETFALVLLIFAFYTYYCDCPHVLLR